jgi:hypothetical protein
VAGRSYILSVVCAVIWFTQSIWRNPWKWNVWTLYDAARRVL